MKYEFDTVEELITALKKEKYTVRSVDDEKSFLEAKVSEAVGKHMGTVLGDLDSTVLESSQIKKDEGEKTSDYVQRTIKGFVDTLTETQSDLKKHVDGEVGKEEVLQTLKAQLETVKSDLKKSVTGREEDQGKFKTAQFDVKVTSVIDAALNKIRPTLKHYAKEGEQDLVLENNIAAVINQFKTDAIAADVDGVLVFKDKDGKPLQSETNGSFLSAEELLNERFLPFVDTTRKKAGTGGAGSVNDKGGENKYKLDIPETVKSQLELTDHLLGALKDKGIDHNSPEMDKYYNANKGNLPFKNYG